MAEHSTVEIGNATLLFVSTDDPLSDGHTTGSLELYNERHRPAFPLTSHTVCDDLESVMHEPSLPAHWKAGRIAGWMEALMENSPQTFRSGLPTERITTLQAV